MARWYRRIFAETDANRQLALICDACEAYEAEYPDALESIKPPTGKMAVMEMKIAGLAAENMARCGDLDIMLQHLENMESVARKKRQEYYMDHYQRKLSESVAKTYADADDEVQAIRSIRFRVGSVSAQFDAISRGLEYMHYQISNLNKLKCAGLDDAEF